MKTSRLILKLMCIVVLMLVCTYPNISCSGEDLPPQTEEPEKNPEEEPKDDPKDDPKDPEEDPKDPEEDPDKPDDPKEDPKLDQALADSLAKAVEGNIAALQMLLSAECISSCEKTADEGVYSITFTDGKTLDINTGLSGLELLTVVSEEGKYVWALIKDGNAVKIEAQGAALTVESAPQMRVTEKGEWQYSVDGGVQWHDAGISIDVTVTSLEIELFKDVKVENGNAVITLAGGTVISIPVVGDGILEAEETSIWFTKLNEKKTVALTTMNVKSLSVTDKPDGWYAELTDNNTLTITSPAEVTEVNKGGNVEITAEFDGNGKTGSITVVVQYDKEIVLSADAYGLVKVSVSEHVAKDYPGYILKAWLTSSFTAEGVISWLNGDGNSTVPYTGTKEFNLADIAEGYVKGKAYTIFAIPAIPQEQISSGSASYNIADLQTVEYTPTDVYVEVTDVRFDSATVNAAYNGVSKYYAGITTASDWNNYVRKNFLEMLGWGGVATLTAATYSGDAAFFPSGEKSITIKPATEYIVWILPENEEGKYTDTDFITKSFTTPDIASGASFDAPAYQVTDLTYGGFTAKVTPTAGAYKTYAAILPAVSIPADEKELVTQLVNTDNHSEGSASLTVSTNSYDSDDEVYLLAVTLDENGRYGKVLKARVELKQLKYSEEIGITACNVSYGLGDVTLELTFKGDPSTITYLTASYTYYTDDVLQRMMAMSQYGDVINRKISNLEDGRKLSFTGLELGTQYTFYAVVKDAEGNPSYMFTHKFIPAIGVNYVMSSSENYTYGMPQISGTWKNKTTYELNVDKPQDCAKFWLQVCDSEYLTGDVYTDTDRLLTLTGYACEVHTDSIKAKRYSYLNSNTRVFIAWLDDKGEYHAIYEFNPNK